MFPVSPLLCPIWLLRCPAGLCFSSVRLFFGSMWLFCSFIGFHVLYGFNSSVYAFAFVLKTLVYGSSRGSVTFQYTSFFTLYGHIIGFQPLFQMFYMVLLMLHRIQLLFYFVQPFFHGVFCCSLGFLCCC